MSMALEPSHAPRKIHGCINKSCMFLGYHESSTFKLAGQPEQWINLPVKHIQNGIPWILQFMLKTMQQKVSLFFHCMVSSVLWWSCWIRYLSTEHQLVSTLMETYSMGVRLKGNVKPQTGYQPFLHRPILSLECFPCMTTVIPFEGTGPASSNQW